jgi:hypothetical protein
MISEVNTAGASVDVRRSTMDAARNTVASEKSLTATLDKV